MSTAYTGRSVGSLLPRTIAIPVSIIILLVVIVAGPA
jgi:hypothetical protein